jgi:hypothetical protein
MRMGHLYHRVLPALRETVIGLLEFSVEQQGVCKGFLLVRVPRLLF